MLEGTCHCGATGWTLTGDPGSITVCNCTQCRRNGTLWAYDFVDGRITIRGETKSYVRKDLATPGLETMFCPTCANIVCWRGLHTMDDGRRRIAVNVRLAPFEHVADLLIDRFDGLTTFTDLPSDGSRVRDWCF